MAPHRPLEQVQVSRFIVPGLVTTDPTLAMQETFAFLFFLVLNSFPGQTFFCSLRALTESVEGALRLGGMV